MSDAAPEALLAALAVHDAVERADWEARWLAFVGSARAAWPEIDLPCDALAQALVQRLASAPDPRAAFAALDAGELSLCCACAAGDRGALRAFDRRFVDGVDDELARMGLDRAAMDDVKQRVRTKLLTADADGSIKLGEYAGQGRLAGLVKVVAMRMALDQIRARRPDAPLDDEARTVDALLDHDIGPELEVVRKQHRDALRAAVAQAIAELPPRDRSLLRMHLLERLSIDGIAALHRVHRGTAARWLVKLRDGLAQRIRTILAEELRLDAAGLASLFRAVESQLDLSLPRLLDSVAEPGDDDELV